MTRRRYALGGLVLLALGLIWSRDSIGQERPPERPALELGSAVSSAGDKPLFALELVAEQLNLPVQTTRQSTTVTIGDTQVIAGPDNPVIIVGRDIVQLGQAPVSGTVGSRAVLLVPLEFLEKSLGALLELELGWNPETRRLTASRRTSRTLPVAIDVVHLRGVSTVVLQFSQPLQYRRVQTAEGIDVMATRDRLEPTGAPFAGGDPLVRDVRVMGDRVRILLAPGAGADSYTLEDPFRLVFDVVAGGGELAQRPDSALGSAPPATGPARDHGFDTIVLDPGHGGSETGAIGPSGTQEKEITLLIAQALQARLREQLGVKVVLTRESDAVVPLDTRSAIANQQKADLFISIHLNSWLEPEAHGAETYFLSLEASDRRAASSAAAENLELDGVDEALDEEGNPLFDLKLMLWDLAQSKHLAASQRVANHVQAELNQAMGLVDRGVKQAPFRVLMGAAMPAVLVELGYVSNPKEESQLRNPEYRANLVEALVRAVARFRAELQPATPPGPAAEPPLPVAPGTPVEPPP